MSKKRSKKQRRRAPSDGAMTPEEVLAVREEFGMTQPEIAAALGMNDPSGSGRVTWSRWENGHARPPVFLRDALDRLRRERGAA